MPEREGHGVRSGTPQSKSKNARWAPAVAVFLALMTLAIFPCICGHLGPEALPFSAAAASLACYGWVTCKAGISVRILHIIVVMFTFLVLAKNVADVLWLGHHPVW